MAKLKNTEIQGTLAVTGSVTAGAGLNIYGETQAKMYVPGCWTSSGCTVAQLINSIKNLNGAYGSFYNSTTLGSLPGSTWYNYIWIPHRHGGGEGDNSNYGTLIITPMTTNSTYLWIVHYITGTVNNPVRFTGA